MDDKKMAAVEAKKAEAAAKVDAVKEAAKGTPLEPLLEPAPDAPADCSKYPYIHHGYCRFCGCENHTGFESFATQAEADDYVSNTCTCSQATKARARREEQNYYSDMIAHVHFRREKHADERAEIAQNAMDTINQLFGTGAEERGALAIDDEVLGFLHTAAMLVYDGLTGPFSTSVAPSISVKITCKKQVLAELKKRTQRAAADFKDRPQIQEFAAGKIAAIDALVAKMTAKQTSSAEQQHF